MSFELICEIEPPTRADLVHARHQIGVLARVADGFLVPDNHLGRATVSSVAVAREVAAMGGRSIACLNSRDRNVLGLQRDLLTAAAYGVRELLLVHGDRPETGRRSDDVTVGGMVAAARAAADDPAFAGAGPFRVGVTARVGAPLARSKRDADFVFAQVSHELGPLLRWRDEVAATGYDGRVYAGVMVVASPAMARRLAAATAELAVPEQVVAAVAADRDAGVRLACELVEALRASGAFDGAHLVPVSRYREVALRLERDGWHRRA